MGNISGLLSADNFFVFLDFDPSQVCNFTAFSALVYLSVGWV